MTTNQLIEKAKSKCYVYGMMAASMLKAGHEERMYAWNDEKKQMMSVLAELDVMKWGELYDILQTAYDAGWKTEYLKN